ncbi:hypothetical protein [Streptomyces sp. NPDC050564]|uniref:hypothetical protein n=1 Tax=Streptomyces sp. NPDC050564 TaxID=3365631 RepID=UPI00379877DA
MPLTEKTLRQAAEQLRRTFDGDPEAFPPQAPPSARGPWRRSLAFIEELADGLLARLPRVAGWERVESLRLGPLGSAGVYGSNVHGRYAAAATVATPVGAPERMVTQRHGSMLNGRMPASAREQVLSGGGRVLCAIGLRHLDQPSLRQARNRKVVRPRLMLGSQAGAA